jgi:phospholipid transport system transporter-binding protein
VVDAAPLRVFDSSALAVLLEFRREALAARLRCRAGPAAGAAGHGGLYGVDGLLNDAA